MKSRAQSAKQKCESARKMTNPTIPIVIEYRVKLYRSSLLRELYKSRVHRPESQETETLS